MKVLHFIARSTSVLCLLIAAGCGKEELVGPADPANEVRHTSSMNDGDAIDANSTAKDPSNTIDPMTLRDGGDGLDDGDGGGGISDDGDDEADGERTKK